MMGCLALASTRLRLPEARQRENAAAGSDAHSAQGPCFQQVAPSNRLIHRILLRCHSSTPLSDRSDLTFRAKSDQCFFERPALRAQQRMTELPSDYLPVKSHCDRHQVINRLPVDDGYLNTWLQSQRCDIAESLWLTLMYPADLDSFSDGNVGQCNPSRLVDGTISGGNGISMGVNTGVPQRRGHSLDHSIGHRMLQPLRLLVNRIPGVAQELHQVGLDQAVAPHHAKGSS